MSRFKRKKMRGPVRPKNRRALFRPRPPCPLTAAGRTDVDYKDLDLLARYTYAEGRIVPARITNISAKMQRKLTNAIKIARQLALMPYTEVQQREQRNAHPELRPSLPPPPRGGERGRARMPGGRPTPTHPTQPTHPASAPSAPSSPSVSAASPSESVAAAAPSSPSPSPSSPSDSGNGKSESESKSESKSGNGGGDGKEEK